MMHTIKKLSKNTFIKNVVIMASGTAAAQLVNMLLQPIITRIYGPEAYGMMGVFIAIVAILGPVAALTYPIAIVLPKNETDAKGLVRLSVIITFSISFVVGLILLLFNEEIANFFQLNDISTYLYLLPLVILFTGFFQVTEQWLIRKKQFGITAKVTFLQSILLNGSKVILGIFLPVAAALITLQTFANAIKVSLVIIFTQNTNHKIVDIFKDNNKKSLKKLSKVYKDFPLFRAPEVFLNAVSQSLPVLMLTSFFGPVSAGFYTISKTVLSVPIQLIGKSVGDVFYPRISEAANKGEDLTRLIKKATASLFLVGLMPFSIVIFFGPTLFSIVFGSDWVTAGEYARWMALGIYFQFINRPSVKALPVLSAQAFHLYYSIFALISRVGVLAIGYYIYASDLIAVAFFGILGSFLNICLIIFTLYFSMNYDKKNVSKI